MNGGRRAVLDFDLEKRLIVLWRRALSTKLAQALSKDGQMIPRRYEFGRCLRTLTENTR